MLPAFAVVDRIYTAVLRSVRGERLGRFSVTPRDGLDLHTWEWHGAEWPGEAIYMVPDAHERPADVQIGETYPARPDVHRVGEPLTTLRRFEDAARIYAVDRIDGHCQPLGLLAVTDRGLTWIESGVGGFHALAPALIRFTPRERLDCVASLDRLLVQQSLHASGPLRPVGPRAFL